jgi:exodeoxyribonuclease V beta subunit
MTSNHAPASAAGAEAFDVVGPLPSPGVTVLEASAGTGKTFTIAALVTRYVAEGTPLSGILAVTFTRMATGELRDRVRARLVSAEDGLGRFLDGAEPPDPEDKILVLLTQGTQAEVGARRENLANALAVFDAATITTIHGFCQLVLGGLGVAGGVAAGAVLREDTSDIVKEVVDDLYVRRSIGWGVPAFSRRDAGVIATAVVSHRDAPLAPGPDKTTPGRRRRFGDAVRGEVEARLLDSNLLTYDDLLIRLRDTLQDPARGTVACERLRSRYKVVLVDEFQDTDPVQWEVFDKAFGTGDTTLVLIGDPKQAIYAFRGADVYTYLAAASRADHRFTLTDNWRSDADLLTAFDAFLDPLRLGHPDIPYRQVNATSSHARPGLVGAGGGALRVRVLHSSDLGLRLTARTKTISKSAAVDFVADDLASDVVDLLSRGAVLVDYAEGRESSRRDVAPGHIAVLVRTNAQASLVHTALRQRGVPAVVAGSENVFATAAARDWLRLLEALEQPSSTSQAVAIAIGPWLGWTAEEIAAADDSDWEGVHARLHQWAEVIRRQGVAALFRAVVSSEGMPGRLLAGDGGERDLTDLAHVSQLLHAESSAHQLGLHALAAWLHRRIDDAGAGADEAEERSRRLDSDADAVQVLTVHRAKGLEFPIVYCPFLWDAAGGGANGRPVLFHDQADGGVRKLDVGGEDGRDYGDHARLEIIDERGEAIRHLYVALTRAKHRVVIWWARVHQCENSPFGRLLFARDAEGNVEPKGRFTPKDEDVDAALSTMGERAEGLMVVERCSTPGSARWYGQLTGSGSSLAAARFERRLDLTWRRASYSSITADAHVRPAGQVSSEPEVSGVGDEPTDERQAAVSALDSGDYPEWAGRLRQTRCLLADTPGGTEVGTFVHAVLSQVDFQAPDLEVALAESVSNQYLRDSTRIGDADSLVAGLAAAIDTPLGRLAGGLSLRSVPQADRLDELGFELPLVGGDHSTGELDVGAIADLFRRHAAAGPLAGYADKMVSAPLTERVKGYLTGSIDLVFRLRSGTAVGLTGRNHDRYFVVDYKTNRLAGSGDDLSAWHYRPEALDLEMQHLHYPLQAVLYSVALHRYLRWRLPAYDPATNLGGVLYLFIRGMLGPETPFVGDEPCGVFTWETPAALVTELSDLLESGSLIASTP